MRDHASFISKRYIYQYGRLSSRELHTSSENSNNISILPRGVASLKIKATGGASSDNLYNVDTEFGFKSYSACLQATALEEEAECSDYNLVRPESESEQNLSNGLAQTPHY